MSDRPELKYFANIINEEISEGGGFAVITADDLEQVIRAVFTELIRHGIKFELHYQKKDPDAFDYSKVPEFVGRHLTKSKNNFFLEVEEEQYKDELGLEITYGGGFFYHADIYDLSIAIPDIKARLAQFEPSKFFNLDDMFKTDRELQEDLQEELKMVF